MEPETITRRRQILVNVAYWVVILAAVYFVLKYLIKIVMPFFLAVIFAAIARAMSRFFTRRLGGLRWKYGSKMKVLGKLQLSKKVSIILCVILLFAVLIGLVTLIIFRLINGGIDVIENIPGFYYANVQPGLEDALEKLETLAAEMNDSAMAMVENSTANVIASVGSKVTEWSGKLLVKVSALASGIPSIFLSTIITMIATVLIAVDFESITAFLNRNIPEKTLQVAADFKDSLLETVWQFIKSYFVIFLITMAEITLGFLLVRQRNALLFAAIIAIFDAFPIVGSGMILLPFSIITIISGKIGKGIGLLIVYLVVVIAREIIEPKIVGKHVGLKPIVTLMCMYIGTKLFGGIGLFLLPILASILVEMNGNGTIRLFKSENEQTAES